MLSPYANMVVMIVTSQVVVVIMRHIKVFTLHCPLLQHLHHCDEYECPHMYKCHHKYCIPTRMLCDGNVDCPDGEDEQFCETFECVGLLRCREDGICVHPTDICDGIVHCLLYSDDEELCDMLPCPRSCICRGAVVKCLNLDSIYVIGSNAKAVIIWHFHVSYDLSFAYFHNILHLKMTHCSFASQAISSEMFSKLSEILTLIIIHSGIHTVQSNSFKSMVKLTKLILKNNHIFEINSFIFKGLQSVINLNLSNFQIHTLHRLSFHGMTKLSYLDLSTNDIQTVRASVFWGLQNILTIDLRNNELILMEPLSQLSLSRPDQVSLYLDSILYCCSVHKSLTCYANSTLHKHNNCIAIVSIFNIIFSISIILATGFIIIISRSNKGSTTHRNILRHLSIANLLQSLHMVLHCLVSILYKDQQISMNTLWVKSLACKSLYITYLFGFLTSNLVMGLVVLDQLIAVKFAFDMDIWSSNFHYVLCGVWIAFGIAAVLTEHFIPNSNVMCVPLVQNESNDESQLIGTILWMTTTYIVLLTIPLMYYIIVNHVKTSNALVQNKHALINQRLILINAIRLTAVAGLTWMAMFGVVSYSFAHPDKKQVITILVDIAVHMQEFVCVLHIGQKMGVGCKKQQ